MASDPPAAPSLTARIAAMLAAGDAGHSVRAGIAVAVLLTSAPVAVWAGARWTEAGVTRDTAAIRQTAAPRIGTLAARDAARAELDPLLSVPGVAGTLEGLARALPTDASLVRAGRPANRRLAIEVLAADPDRLRAALRRNSVTAAMRDAGQRRGDGAMTVVLEEAR